MTPHEIKLGHCYSMAPINGQRTIARVAEILRITAMEAYEEIKIAVGLVILALIVFRIGLRRYRE